MSVNIRSVWYEDRPTDRSYPKRSDHRVTAFLFFVFFLSPAQSVPRSVAMETDRPLSITEISPHKLHILSPQKDSFTNVMVKQDSVYCNFSPDFDAQFVQCVLIQQDNIKVLPPQRPWPGPKASPENQRLPRVYSRHQGGSRWHTGVFLHRLLGLLTWFRPPGAPRALRLREHTR